VRIFMHFGSQDLHVKMLNPMVWKLSWPTGRPKCLCLFPDFSPLSGFSNLLFLDYVWSTLPIIWKSFHWGRIQAN
jgi:hypothetical protein